MTSANSNHESLQYQLKPVYQTLLCSDVVSWRIYCPLTYKRPMRLIDFLKIICTQCVLFSKKKQYSLKSCHEISVWKKCDETTLTHLSKSCGFPLTSTNWNKIVNIEKFKFFLFYPSKSAHAILADTAPTTTKKE